MLAAEALHFPGLLVPTVTAAPAGCPYHVLVPLMIATLKAVHANHTALVGAAIEALHYQLAML